MNRLCFLFLPLLLAAAPALSTQPAAAPVMPPWEQLTPAQRDLLVAPMRERWNDNPGSRARLFAHAQRWQQMTPVQRARAHHGMRRWESMDPEQRDAMRALFGKMRHMTTEQRESLREQWHAMTSEQRRAWVEANPPSAD